MQYCYNQHSVLRYIWLNFDICKLCKLWTNLHKDSNFKVKVFYVAFHLQQALPSVFRESLNAACKTVPVSFVPDFIAFTSSVGSISSRESGHQFNLNNKGQIYRWHVCKYFSFLFVWPVLLQKVLKLNVIPKNIFCYFLTWTHR